MAGWGMLYTSLVLFATVHSKELNMEPNAVDDAYSKCRDEMLQKVLDRDGILQKELQTNSVFRDVWNAIKCQNPIPAGRKEHTQALQSIDNSRKLLKQLNTAVQTKGGNVSIYTEQFHFKSLHFLLVDAMRLLKEEKCRTVYSGTFEDVTAVKGSKVRFGRFVSANNEAERSLAEEGCVADGTLFNITSCSVIDVEKHSCSPDNVLLLISPAEVFTVVDVHAGTDCKREIVLTSAGFRNDHDCYLLPRLATTIAPTVPRTSAEGNSSGTGSSTQWASSSGVVLLTTVLNMCIIFLAL